MLYVSATLAYGDRPVVGGAGEESTMTSKDGSGEGHEAEGISQGKDGIKKTKIQIRVDTKVKNVEHGETKPTGQFNYTFEVDGEVQVLPETYQEFMIYLEARRRSKGRV